MTAPSWRSDSSAVAQRASAPAEARRAKAEGGNDEIIHQCRPGGSRDDWLGEAEPLSGRRALTSHRFRSEPSRALHRERAREHWSYGTLRSPVLARGIPYGPSDAAAIWTIDAASKAEPRIVRIVFRIINLLVQALCCEAKGVSRLSALSPR